MTHKGFTTTLDWAALQFPEVVVSFKSKKAPKVHYRQITEKMLRGYDSKTGVWACGHRFKYRGIKPKVGEYIAYFTSDPKEDRQFVVLVTAKRMADIIEKPCRRNAYWRRLKCQS